MPGQAALQAFDAVLCSPADPGIASSGGLGYFVPPSDHETLVEEHGRIRSAIIRV